MLSKLTWALRRTTIHSMTIAEKSPVSRPPKAPRAARRSKSSNQAEMRVFAFSGDPEMASALPLPDHARLAMVTTSRSAVQQMMDRGFELEPLSDRALILDKGEQDNGNMSAAFQPDARARSILRGRQMARHDIAAAGGTYDLDDVRGLLGDISRQAVDKRVREGSLIAVSGPKNRRRYPTVQFETNGTVVAGLREVQAALPTRNPWAVLNFLVRPEARLEGSPPIALLRQGRVAEVVEAARRMGEQGA